LLLARGALFDRVSIVTSAQLKYFNVIYDNSEVSNKLTTGTDFADYAVFDHPA
jgi:hypothetical protein